MKSSPAFRIKETENLMFFFSIIRLFFSVRSNFSSLLYFPNVVLSLAAPLLVKILRTVNRRSNFRDFIHSATGFLKLIEE